MFLLQRRIRVIFCRLQTKKSIAIPQPENVGFHSFFAASLQKTPPTCSGHDDGCGPHWGCCRVCGPGATRFTVLLSLLSTVNVSSELRRRCLSRRTRNRRRPRPSNAPRDPPSLFVPPILPRGRLLLLPPPLQPLPTLCAHVPLMRLGNRQVPPAAATAAGQTG